MFINIEKGKLKLYDLKIYKKLNQTILKLTKEGISEKHSIETTFIPYKEGQIINNEKMVSGIYYENTGKVITYNDFYSNDEEVYLYHYTLINLPSLYFVLVALKNSDYDSLIKLNRYLNHEIVNENEIFEKYKKEIFKAIKIVELLEIDVNDLNISYEQLLANCKTNKKDQLYNNLLNIKQYLNIKQIDMSLFNVEKRKI